jgi:DNA-binding YbaB/EbfC family protein
MTQPPSGRPPDGPPDLTNLFAQAQQLQQQMLAAQERAKAKTVEASAGGGMVTATMNGALELISLKIDPQAVDPRDVVMLQDLVIAAVNQAVAKAQEMMQGEMQQVAGGMLPGLF